MINSLTSPTGPNATISPLLKRLRCAWPRPLRATLMPSPTSSSRSCAASIPRVKSWNCSAPSGFSIISTDSTTPCKWSPPGLGKAAVPRRPSRPRLLDRGNFPATRRVSDRSATRTPSPRPHALAVSPQGDLSSHEIAVACRDLSRLSLRLRRHHRRFDASSLHCLEKVPRGVELRVRRAAFLFLGRDAGCRDHRRPKSKKRPDNAGRSGGHTQREPLP